FNATPPTGIYTLSLHDALPISRRRRLLLGRADLVVAVEGGDLVALGEGRIVEDAVDEVIERARERHHGLADVDELGGPGSDDVEDRKSTRLNSSHVSISYAVFC